MARLECLVLGGYVQFRDDSSGICPKTLFVVLLGLSGAGNRDPRVARTAGHSQQEALHLRRELAACGFLLGEAEGPIEQGNEIADRYNAAEPVVVRRILVLPQGVGGDIDQRVNAEPCGNLQLTVTPANGEQLAACGENQEQENSQNCGGLLEMQKES